MNRLPRPKTQPASRRHVPWGWTGLFLAVLAASQFLALRLPAADVFWSGAISTDWNNPANWVGGVLPGTSDNAHLDVSGATTDIDPFSDPGFNTTVQQLYIGDTNPNATFTQSSGTLNLNGGQAWLKIGAQSGSSGIYNLQGTGIVSLTNDVFGVGEHGVGTFNLSNSAQATAPRIAVGRYAEGRGDVFQTGGTSITVTGSGNDGNGTPNYSLAIGEQSTALSSYTVTGGTLTVSGGNMIVGMTTGSNGRMTLAGTGAVSAAHEVHVGEAGAGTFVVNGGQLTAAGPIIVGNSNGGSGTVTQNGGSVSLTGAANLVLGNQGGGVGTYTLAGGTLAAGGRILVGEDGLATFTQTGGAATVTQDVSIGDHVGFSTAASPDTYSISGGTLAAASIQVGWQGYAVMNQSGGSVTATTDVHFGGSATGGVQNGRGIYNLSGGTLITPSIFVSSAGNQAHQFNFTGGTLRLGSYNTTGTTTILGTLTQTSAAAPSLLDVTTQNTTIGASYSLSGQNATAAIDNGKSLHFAGILSIDNQAAVSMTANAANQLLIDGSATNPNNSLNVGVGGAGQLAIAGGTFTVTTGDTIIGKNSGSSGVVTQSGGTASLHAASPNWFFLGQSAGAQGSYNLTGGTLTEPNNEEIGYGGSGTFTQSGGMNTPGTLSLGRQATGNGAYLLNGGTLIAGSVIGGEGISTFKFNGGTLQPSATSAAFFQGLTSAIVQSGGAVVNTNGKNITIAQSLLHDAGLGATADGGLTKNGSGSLTLGGSNTYSGVTTVNSGALTTTATGTIGSGPLAVDSSSGAISVASLGSSQTVSALSSAVSGNGSATLNIASGTTLSVNQAGNTMFAGTIANSGTLAKTGAGTLEINGATAFAANSVLQVNGGKLRLNVTSGLPSLGSGVTATVSTGATLELAGSISTLATGPNRANVQNNSQAAAGGLLASGTNQQIGNLDGTGNTVVADGAALTANHIVQNALSIGASMNNRATVTIAASDAAGNSLVAEDLSLLSGSSGTAPLPAAITILPEASLSAALGDAPIGFESTTVDVAAVPEPATLSLLASAAILLTCLARSRYARAIREPAASCNPC